MALSEHEQRLLDEMERNFYRSDAEFGVAGRGGVNYTAITLGALVIVVGIALAVVGVATQLWWLGVVGFVVMFGGALLMLRRTPASSSALPRPERETRAGTEFMNAFERRWERRQDRHDGAD